MTADATKDIQAAPTTAVDPREAAKKRVQDLVEGKVPPPNEYAAHIVKKIQSVWGEGQQTSKQIQTLEGQLMQLREKQLKLQGAGDMYLQDLQEWDRNLTEG